MDPICQMQLCGQQFQFTKQHIQRPNSKGAFINYEIGGRGGRFEGGPENFLQ